MKKQSALKDRVSLKSSGLLLLLLILLSSCSSYFLATHQSHALVEINSSIEPNEAIVKMTSPYKTKLDAEMNRVIGQSDVRMTKPGNQSETLLGNFFTDVILQEGKKFDQDVQIAFATKGGLRIELPKGDITVSHIFELMPFENKLSVLELSGESIEILANFIASSGGQPISGMHIKIHEGKAVQIEVAGQKLDSKKIYKIITYDYLANGGDNSRGLTQALTRVDLDLKVRDCLLQYIENQTKAGLPLTSKLDGRVTSNE